MAESAHERAVRNVDTLYRYYTTVDPAPFKAKHYQALLKSLKEITLDSIDDVAKIDTGRGLKRKLEILVSNGEDFPELRTIDIDALSHISTLSTVYGVGPAKARELVITHNIRSMDQLRENKQLLNKKQLLGLEHYEDIHKRIPYEEMCKHNENLSNVLTSLGVKKYGVMGSFRRKSKDSGDIDLLVSGPKNPMKPLIASLTKSGYLWPEPLASGTLKYMGLCRLPGGEAWRRIDILYSPPKEYPFAVLYFTGSMQFNTKMRGRALERGLSLNEKGFTIVDKDSLDAIDKEFACERDIFDYLEMDYVAPTER